MTPPSPSRSPTPSGARRRAAACALLALSLGGQAAAGPRQPALGQQPDAAASKDAKAEALRRFNRGVELSKEGDPRSALVEFRRAYALVPNYRVLYNIGQVSYELQDYVGAVRSFEEYLSAGAKEIPKKRRDEVEKEIVKLRARVASAEVTVNADGAEISVDDAPAGKAPLREPLLLNPGKHKISAAADGKKPASQSVDVAGGDSVKVALSLDDDKAPEPPPTTPPPPPPPPARSFPWVAWGVTGVFVAGSVVTGVLALRASSRLDEQQNTLPVSRGDLDATRRQMRGFAIATDVLGGAAIVAGAVATYLTLRKPSSEAPPVALGVSPSGVSLTGSF